MSYGSKRGAAALFLVWLLVGCAGLDSKTTTAPMEAKDVVAGLAAERWKALMQGDLAKAYSYLGPGTRNVISLDTFRKRFRLGLWEKATVETVSCEAERCKVALLLSLKNARGGKPIDVHVEELWVKESSDWWYVWN